MEWLGNRWVNINLKHSSVNYNYNHNGYYLYSLTLLDEWGFKEESWQVLQITFLLGYPSLPLSDLRKRWQRYLSPLPPYLHHVLCPSKLPLETPRHGMLTIQRIPHLDDVLEKFKGICMVHIVLLHYHVDKLDTKNCCVMIRSHYWNDNGIVNAFDRGKYISIPSHRSFPYHLL